MTEEKQTETVGVPVGVKISYLRDRNNVDRVLTVVRVFDPATQSVKFGWSINCPTEWKRADGVTVVEGKRCGTIVFTEKRGDQFCRKTGRELALNKMKDEAHVAYLESKVEPPLRAVLKFIVAEGERLELPYQVIAIAKQQIPYLFDRVPVKGVGPTPKKSWLDKMIAWFRGA